jgi:predicted amino acid-binding ACT domain protein
MKAVITVVGKDKCGILSNVSTACSEEKANIIEVTVRFGGYVLHDYVGRHLLF